VHGTVAEYFLTPPAFNCCSSYHWAAVGLIGRNRITFWTCTGHKASYTLWAIRSVNTWILLRRNEHKTTAFDTVSKEIWSGWTTAHKPLVEAFQQTGIVW
jgi:hypothetical protein